MFVMMWNGEVEWFEKGEDWGDVMEVWFGERRFMIDENGKLWNEDDWKEDDGVERWFGEVIGESEELCWEVVR